MKILIVDDESLARDRLARLLAEMGDAHIISMAAHGLEALEKIKNKPPDVILLDIRMPIMDGLELAHHLTVLESPPAIIFTTAYQDHALEAFDAQAVDYLLKPVRRERLRQALERAGVLQRARINELRKQDKLTRAYLSATAHGNIQLVPVRDIRYLKAEQKYVIVAWPGGEILIDESLKSLEAEFHGSFIRIHRNALVAVEYIDGLKKGADGSMCVIMRGISPMLLVSRRHLSQVRKVLNSAIS
jgi:two-component system, LytTR family, response regulator AlgR